MQLSSIPCEIALASGDVLRYGDGPPEFRLRLKSDGAFRRGIEELAIARAYVEGEFEFELDMSRALDVRENLQWTPPVGLLAKLWLKRIVRPLTGENKAAIESHYSLGDDFYLKFIDRRWRFYSHGLFHDETETIEEASEHKLERMFTSLRLKPGMRLLDIGAGWGGVEEYCGKRGINVTDLSGILCVRSYLNPEGGWYDPKEREHRRHCRRGEEGPRQEAEEEERAAAI